jgi:Cu-Zn family superoxide dismutase
MRTRRSRALLAIVGGSVILGSLGGGGALAIGQSAKVSLTDAGGAAVGQVKLTQVGDVVTVRAEVQGVAPGFHGFHVRAIGTCVPPFTSAGGHFNPTATPHGNHAGDMPPLLVMDDGTASTRFQTDRFTLQQLYDTDGSAIIIHADRDNLANIPARYHSHTEDVFGPDSATLATGDAGGRFACGVVE